VGAAAAAPRPDPGQRVHPALSIEAEYRGWELTRVRLYTDGSRRVLLRRKKSAVNGLGTADQPAM
jgi:hypothetical protein